MANMLVIGLGGTGIKTLQHLKMLLVKQKGQELPANISLLGLDTMPNPENVENINTGNMGLLQEQRLNPSAEYFPLSGDATDWVMGSTAKGMTPMTDKHYIANWFDYKYFKDYRPTLLNIQEGAGMYPQIGLLSLYYHLRAGEASDLYSKLEQKIMALPQGPITLIICGSLAGGTGTSLFIDVAHLVKAIGDHVGRPSPKTYAMLVLPEAFKYTPPVVVNAAMKARTLAALRELSRMITPRDSNLGYLFRFVDMPEENHPLVTRTKGSLFRIVYLFESRNVHSTGTIINPLDEVKMEHGIAPTIAQWILALNDEVTGETLARALANRDNIAGTLANGGANNPLADAVGTYSVVLPRREILESWKSKLALEVLDALVPVDENGDLTPIMSVGKERPRGKSQVEAYWKSHPAPSSREAGIRGGKLKIDEERNESLADALNKYKSLVDEVTRRTEKEWKAYLSPSSADDEDNRTYDIGAGKSFYSLTAGWLQDPLKDCMVGIKDPQGHGGAMQAANALVTACDTQEKSILDGLDGILIRWQKNQQAEFYEHLTRQANNVLNGTSEARPENAPENRSGKLGWLIDFVQEMASNLFNAKAIYTRAREDLVADVKNQLSRDPDLNSYVNQQIGMNDASLLDLETLLSRVCTEMETNARKQKHYLKMRQYSLVWKRRDMLLQKQIELTTETHRYVRELERNLQKFAVLLRTGSRNLYSDLETYMMQIQADRDAMKNWLPKVKDVVQSDVWEGQLYRKVVTGGEGKHASNRVLGDFLWSINSIDDVRQKKTARMPEVVLTLDGTEIHVASDNQPEYISALETDFDRLLARCQTEMKVPEQLNILGYMNDHWNGQTANHTTQNYAKFLLDKVDVLLRLPHGMATKDVEYSFLMTKTRNITDAHRVWLDSLGAAIKTQAGLTATGQSHSGSLDSDDDCTLTFLLYKGLANIYELNAFSEGLQGYVERPIKGVEASLSRHLLHIHTAEQLCLPYENPASPIDLLPPRIVSVFEETSRLYTFVLAWAFKLIQERTSFQGTRTIGVVQQVEIPPRPGEVEGPLKQPVTGILQWKLNSPTDFPFAPTSFLVAAETFCLRKVDFGERPRSINELHDRLSDSTSQLLALETLEVEKRLPLWQKGEGTPVARTVIHMPDGPKKTADLLAIARAEVLHEFLLLLQTRSSALEQSTTDNTTRGSAIEQIRPLEIRFLKVLEEIVRDQISKEIQSVG